MPGSVEELSEPLNMRKSTARPQREVKGGKALREAAQLALVLEPAQRRRLQQQMQQHVQLLTQIYLLASAQPTLSREAMVSRLFLEDLENTLHQQLRPCNLTGAMQLIEDLTHVSVDQSPHQTGNGTASEFACLPKQMAWIFATRKVFMYPELLPVCSFEARDLQRRIVYTKAEDNLLALGLKHFEGTDAPKPLISKYLLTCKTARQLSVRIKNLSVNKAPNNIIKFYKMTKQLPDLKKCCEDVQPHQWKPPLEREEHRLPFWLKASLPSIQNKLQHIADGARGVGSMTANAGINSDPDIEKGTSELGAETQYPLMLPKDIVLNLKPFATHFTRKTWRRKGSSALKPVPIRPSSCLQSASGSGKTLASSTESETLPSKAVVPIPHLTQPAPVLQTVPEVPPLGGTRSDSFESLPVLSAVLLKASTNIPLFVSQTPLSSASLPKVPLPSLAPSKSRKPYVKKRGGKRKGLKPALCLKATPAVQTASVIFSVPATTVKVLSLGSSCNIIQPVSATVSQSTQTIAITSLLVNPSSFHCPLNQQPLVTSSIPTLIVSGNSVNVNLPVSPTPEDKTQVNVNAGCPLSEGNSSFQDLKPKLEPQELSPLCATAFPKEEHSPNPSTADGRCQEEMPENSVCGWTNVKIEERSQALEVQLPGLQKPLNSPQEYLKVIVKMEPEDPGEKILSQFSEHFMYDGIKEENSVE